MRTHAYRNLHKDLWSLRSPSTGLVTGHAAHVELRDVSFRIQEAGRRAQLADGIRRVHAYVVGDLVAARARRLPRRGRWVRFTYRAEVGFVVADTADQRPIFHAARVRLDRDGAWCQAPEYERRTR